MFTLNTSIPIQIHLFFFLVALILGFIWSDGNGVLTVVIAAIVTVSILVHEFGHALTGIIFRQKVKISLLPFGGLTERQGKPLRGWQDFLIVLMGPAFGFMLYAIASMLWIYYPSGMPGRIFAIAAAINFYWTLLNLLPVLPLDGGQLVRVVLQGVWGVRGLKMACLLSMGLGALLAVGFIVRYQDFLIGSIFAIFTYESWRIYSDVRFLKDHDTDVDLQRLLSKGEKAHERGEDEKSHDIFCQVRRQVQGGALYNLATLRLAERAFDQEHYEEGYQLLEPIKKELSLDGLILFQELAFRTSHWADALLAGTKISQVAPTPDLAIQNAKASAELGDKIAEEGWMKSSKRLKG